MTQMETVLPDTPMMRQYQAVKQNYQQEILFFSFGGFL